MRSKQGIERRRQLDRMRFPDERKRRFLDHFWATLDVDGACAAAGVSWRDMCSLRDEDPDFAADWERAIEAGYERAEIMLLRRAGGAPATADEADIELARELIKLRASRKGSRRSGANRDKPSRERRLLSVMNKIRAMRPRAEKDDGNETGGPVARLARDAGDAPERGRCGPDG